MSENRRRRIGGLIAIINYILQYWTTDTGDNITDDLGSRIVFKTEE